MQRLVAIQDELKPDRQRSQFAAAGAERLDKIHVDAVGGSLRCTLGEGGAYIQLRPSTRHDAAQRIVQGTKR
jgi:hypothetical protein